MKNCLSAILLSFCFTTIVLAQSPGTLNSNFNDTGWDTLYGNDNGFTIQKILIQADQKIVVVAEANNSGEAHQAVVIRYNPDGSLDEVFGGGDGMVRSRDDFGAFTRAYDMALQSNGKIIIAGDQLYNSERIFRLNTDGSLDLSFGENGIADFTRPNNEFIYKTAVQSDDKILVVGRESRMFDGMFRPHVFIWRLTADGSLDPTFGENGVVSYYESEQGDFEDYLRINDLHVLADDKFLINQSFTNYPDTYVQFKKFNADGSVDNSFGNQGRALKAHRSNDGIYTYSSSDIDEQGNIFFSASIRDTINFNNTYRVLRINQLGVLDDSFEINLNFETTLIRLFRLKVLGNKLYVLGKEQIEGYSHDKIYCYALNGNLESGFGNNGIAIINQNDISISGEGVFDISANGNIYLASSSSDPNNFNNELFLVSNVIGFPFETSVGINTVSTSNFKLFPCPADKVLSIQTVDSERNDFAIRDLNGKLVFAFSTSSTLETIDVSSLKNGIYFIQDLKRGKGVSFVVQH